MNSELSFVKFLYTKNVSKAKPRDLEVKSLDLIFELLSQVFDILRRPIWHIHP